MSEFQLDAQLANDSLFLADWPLCQLRLVNNANLPWFLLVPRVAGISEIYQLSEADRMQLWRESDRLSRELMTYFKGDKLNVAAIGNVVAQLHLHHVVRFKDDPCWPAPVWGKLEAKPWSAVELAPVKEWAEQLIHIQAWG